MSDDLTADQQELAARLETVFSQLDPFPRGVRELAYELLVLKQDPHSEQALLVLIEMGPSAVDRLLEATRSKPLARTVIHHPSLVYPRTLTLAAFILSHEPCDDDPMG